MEELEKTARELILAITEKTLKTLKDKGLLKEPSKLQMLSSSPEMKSLIKKLSAPKYDPCREFRAGDKVSPRFWHDRPPVASAYCGDSAFMPKDGVYEVKEDERNSQVLIDYHGKLVFVSACHLELMTPVEELESFGVRYSTDRDCAEVYHRRYKNTVAVFYRKCGITREQAEAHAEAERDRLNKEYREETEK